MKNLLRTILAALLLTACIQAHAAEVWHTAYVTRVYPQPDGSVRLAFSSDHASCTNNSTPKWHFIVVGQNSVTADGLRAMHSIALTALAMERQVSIAFDDATASCYINRLQILEQ